MARLVDPGRCEHPCPHCPKEALGAIPLGHKLNALQIELGRRVDRLCKQIRLSDGNPEHFTDAQKKLIAKAGNALWGDIRCLKEAVEEAKQR